jgi:hypothetical protein
MFKKIITIGFLTLIITLLFIPVTFAQRAIDPALKPQNAPGVPLTGPGFKECMAEHQNDDEQIKDIYNQIQGKDQEAIEQIIEDNKEIIQKYWDVNSQMCRGHEEEPITAFIQIIAGALLMLTGGIAVIVIAVGGVMYIVSGGNQQQMEYAKNTLKYGFIGMAVVIFSYYIVQLVLQLIIG